jgi:hypothetical protein
MRPFSTRRQTGDAATATNVAQMAAAVDAIYRTHSRGYRHDYRANWQLLDVDLTGMPCGKKAALQPLVEAAEQTLSLKEAQRARTTCPSRQSAAARFAPILPRGGSPATAPPPVGTTRHTTAGRAVPGQVESARVANR